MKLLGDFLFRMGIDLCRVFFSCCYMDFMGVGGVIMILGKIIFYILCTVLPYHDNGPRAEAGCMRNTRKNV